MMLIKKMLYVVFMFSIITVAHASENNTESPVDTSTEVTTEVPTIVPTQTPAEVIHNEATPAEVTHTGATPAEDTGPKVEVSAIAIATSDNNSAETSVVIGAENNKTIIKDDSGTTVITNVSAFAYSGGKGDNLSLISRAYVEGHIVRGTGGSNIEGEQTNAGVSITVKALENGLNSLTIISYASGLDAIGYTWVSAWAETVERFSRAKEYVRQNTAFSGFLFGRSDTERYTYFKSQSINLGARNSTRQRADYWMEIIANDYGINRTQFEKKYNITTNMFNGVELVNISKGKNIVIVRINGTLYDIPYGRELNIEGKKINITEVNETNNIVGIKVVNMKGTSG